MQLHVLGCYGGEAPGCHNTSFLVDGHLLLDAGSVSAVLPLDAQARIDCGGIDDHCIEIGECRGFSEA